MLHVSVLLDRSQATLHSSKPCAGSQVQIFQCYCIFVIHTKIHLFENITVLPFLSYFPLAASVFLCCFIYRYEHGCGVGIVVITICPISMYVPAVQLYVTFA
jgi:hypothetical protein